MFAARGLGPVKVCAHWFAGAVNSQIHYYVWDQWHAADLKVLFMNFELWGGCVPIATAAFQTPSQNPIDSLVPVPIHHSPSTPLGRFDSLARLISQGGGPGFLWGETLMGIHSPLIKQGMSLVSFNLDPPGLFPIKSSNYWVRLSNRQMHA